MLELISSGFKNQSLDSQYDQLKLEEVECDLSIDQKLLEDAMSSQPAQNAPQVNIIPDATKKTATKKPAGKKRLIKNTEKEKKQKKQKVSKEDTPVQITKYC